MLYLRQDVFHRCGKSKGPRLHNLSLILRRMACVKCGVNAYINAGPAPAVPRHHWRQSVTPKEGTFRRGSVVLSIFSYSWARGGPSVVQNQSFLDQQGAVVAVGQCVKAQGNNQDRGCIGGCRSQEDAHLPARAWRSGLWGQNHQHAMMKIILAFLCVLGLYLSHCHIKIICTVYEVFHFLALCILSKNCSDMDVT